MAGQPPDPRTLNSWDDAFQHPLPVVRKLEQQLRKNIDDNRQKLRSLVGASYRDLLGTAERIIEMDDRVQTVETYLGDIGKKCNARTVERIAENHVRMRKMKEGRDAESYRVMAQTKVLQSALTAATRTTKAGGDALLAAKLFVLSRLLHKSVSESLHPSPVLEDLKRKLNALRSRLLSYIERGLVTLQAEKQQLGHILCAYALVTSSGPKEVLRHFLQMRYDQLDNKPDSPSEMDVLQMLDLYSRTLFDTRELFPRRFADALSQLSKAPLLQDEQIQSVHELNIDIYRVWIAEDVRTFTPWIRHDQLVASEVSDALVSWTKSAQNCLLTRLRDHLQSQNDAHEILKSRQKFISKFIGLSSKLRNSASTSAIQDLRVTFLTRLEELAVQSASLTHLRLAESEVSQLPNQDANESAIWDLATQDFDLSHGAFKLRQTILQKRHGRGDRIRGETQKLDEWIERVSDVLDIADVMSSTRWDDDLDFDLDDLDDGDSIQRNLSKEDPEQLRETVRDACRASLQDVMGKISESVESTQYSTFYLRIWREVDLRRRALETRLNVPPSQISLVALHRNIASSVSEEAIQKYVTAAKVRTSAAVTLWDGGTPALPTQPSPSTFRFLTTLHKEMSDAGIDLWTPPCVFELKRIVLDSLSRELDDENFTDPARKTALTNGHLEETEEEKGAGAGDDDDDEDNQDESKSGAKTEEVFSEVQSSEDDAQLTQNLFDMYYLSRVFHHSADGQDSARMLGSLIPAMREKSHLDDAGHERLKKSAGEYWRRTYLLFGFLGS